ncbi:TetR/AcrR family transcriptional regulator [Paenibacillus sp. L3-i20]|uniref:TetR/AcrR family transcriptional regulator n=1 Tax=Paenibacillus sp. L3-i20 TaxID=2905833 RepID=UPI001EDE9CE7|nr:TetR/AcrR family transcriptional regulator [Paenibacillus sp. L3-i20]GKU76176.1 AcrR family transcriptional regulator [Paenibacillus sp. L3-i20]
MQPAPLDFSLQTNEWIETALLKLMENNHYTKITITEIAVTAGIVRQTLYLHFTDKDAILLTILNKLMNEVWKQFDDIRSNREEVFAALFRNWKQHIPPSLLYNITFKDRKIRQLIYKSITDYVDKQFASKQTSIDFYTRRAYCSTIHNLLVEWTLQDFYHSPEDMGALVCKLTASMRECME